MSATDQILESECVALADDQADAPVAATSAMAATLGV